MRIAYQNLQCVGKTSKPSKQEAILKGLRNFYLWYPEVFFFVECGLTLDDDDYEEFGETLFAPNSSCHSSRWGFNYDYCDPHKTGGHKKTEHFAVFMKQDNPAAHHRRSLLSVVDADVKHESERLGVRTHNFGTRQFGVATLTSKDTGKNLLVLLCHPSPTAAVLAVLNMLQFAHKNYIEKSIPFIMLGDFNVKPDERISTRGKDTLKEAEEWAADHQAPPGLLGYLRSCVCRSGSSELFSMKELARFFGMEVKNAGQNTHKNGELDYVIHSHGLTVSQTAVLTNEAGGSDHNAIYFDVTF